MKSQQIPRGIFIGFGIVAVLFLALYILLSFHNRPAADDFYFLGSVQSKGIWNTALDAYNTWITRWSTLLFLGVMVNIFQAGQSLLWFHLFTLLMLLLGSGLVIRKIVELKYNSTPGPWLTVIYSILFTASFFLLSFSAGETFFWFTSVCMYLWPMIAFAFGVYFLISPARKIYSFTLLLCFLFIGGGSEVVALEVLLFLALIFWKRDRNKLFALFESVSKRTLILALAALTLSLFIAWLGQGRLARQEALPDASFDRLLLLSLKSSVYFLLTQLPLKIHWILFYTIPWIVFKNRILPAEKKPVTVVFKNIARDFFVFLLFVFIHFTIVVFLLRSFPPPRTWITLSLGLSIFCAVTGWRLGSLVTSSKGILSASVIFILFSSLFLINTIRSEQSSGAAYSKAVDERMALLRNKFRKEITMIEVKPLPPPGMLYSAEISSDTGHFTNKHLQEYLGLKMTVRKGE